MGGERISRRRALQLGAAVTLEGFLLAVGLGKKAEAGGGREPLTEQARKFAETIGAKFFDFSKLTGEAGKVWSNGSSWLVDRDVVIVAGGERWTQQQGGSWEHTGDVSYMVDSNCSRHYLNLEESKRYPDDHYNDVTKWAMAFNGSGITAKRRLGVLFEHDKEVEGITNGWALELWSDGSTKFYAQAGNRYDAQLQAAPEIVLP